MLFVTTIVIIIAIIIRIGHKPTKTLLLKSNNLIEYYS